AGHASAQSRSWEIPFKSGPRQRYQSKLAAAVDAAKNAMSRPDNPPRPETNFRASMRRTLVLAAAVSIVVTVGWQRLPPTLGQPKNFVLRPRPGEEFGVARTTLQG